MIIIPKGWGQEEIWADQPGYCGKNMVFETGKCFSMHFHRTKDETWLVQSGKFRLIWIDTEKAMKHTRRLRPGDTWRNAPLVPHQLICLESGTVVEVSTHDDPYDNYRIERGDSQR